MSTYVEDLKSDLMKAVEDDHWETVDYVLGKIREKGVGLSLDTQEIMFLKFCEDILTHRITEPDRLMASGLALASMLDSCESLTEKSRANTIAAVTSILVDLQMNHFAFEEAKPESELLTLYTKLEKQAFDKQVQSEVTGILDVAQHMLESCLSFFQKDKQAAISVEMPNSPELR